MAGVPVVFRDQRERVLQNYNYIDLIQGQGVVSFYLFQLETAAAADLYAATSISTTRSKEIEKHNTRGGGSNTSDFDFDVGQFNQNMTIEGTAYCSGSFGITLSSGSGTAGDFSIQFLIRKFDGTTETEIADETSSAISASGGGEANYNIPITIPKTTFKAGDLLRITVALIKDGGSGGTWDTYFGTDPLNRDGTRFEPGQDDGFTTVTKVQIPFKIDL
jgi:hypothetical protein